jgi:glycosyltransferase involved in cell wall biosynthesis
LYIIGDGSEREKLQNLIDENELQEKVILCGQKSADKVSKLLESSDCFVLTSRRETFGIVYIEAMAKGMPVIATKCGGPENFVNSGNGLLIPIDNIEATTNALDYMFIHAHNYDSARIKRDCYENFSEECISRKIIDVYKSILSNEKKIPNK